MQTVTLNDLQEQSYAMTESLRALKTNLQFCGDDIKTIMITSTIPNEGKSTVAMNLARSLVESDKRVLVIDTDMRKSVLAGRLKARSNQGTQIGGLSHYLSGQKSLDEVLCATSVPKLFMVFAGPSVPNPTEILDKKYFKELVDFAREHFNYIIMDCAPLGAAIDAAVVAKYCDGAILVVAQGMAGTRMIIGAKKQLETAGVKILGAVMNRVKTKKKRYGYGSKYGYGKYYGSYYGEYYHKDEGEA